MEFLSQTYLETTTQIEVNSNTITSEFFINPDVRYQYVSDAYNNDALTTTIKINFDSTQTISRIAIMEMNWKKFNVYYNGATANAFVITSPTTATNFITNSATSIYLACTAQECTSVSFDVYSTIVANSEKAVGYIYTGANQLTFSRIPNASNYTPLKDPKELIHELSDGGTRRHVVQTKWSAKLKLNYVTETFKNSLLTIHEALSPVVFVPFGTGTSWDGVLFEANWMGNFDFYKYADDNTNAGFTGSIDLKET